ncbi:Hypothetical Protein FCC1311_019322 [Hondaea fermentalgiana]|uniref:Myb-like domain-containing protein n=1 Tax=Hondaea fermentalgiana TaxID=2315210 RepID=A0A2R5GAY4_9STRA|nr:Hypothetical Protein FCC1311_019322 [Hondaea fermentalgiana]|eukprot:GBG25713.1 Hypothetical Protein FCC1311_019322 [Hondaea fermentalgiana]
MGRGKGWREEEDHLLCRAYAVAWRECRSKARTQDGFWQEALGAYSRRAPNDFVQRTPEGLRKRWAKIRTHVTKYRDAVRKVEEEALAPPGSADFDKYVNQYYVMSLKNEQRSVGKFRFTWCYEYFKGSRGKLLKVIIGRPKESRRPDEPDYESESDVELDDEDQIMLNQLQMAKEQQQQQQQQQQNSNALGSAALAPVGAAGSGGAEGVPPPPPPPPLPPAAHEQSQTQPQWAANGTSSGSTPVADVIASTIGVRPRSRSGAGLTSPTSKRQKTEQAASDLSIKVTLQEVISYLRTPEPPKGDHRHPLWKETGLQLMDAIAVSHMEISRRDLLDFTAWKSTRDAGGEGSSAQGPNEGSAMSSTHAAEEGAPPPPSADSQPQHAQDEDHVQDQEQVQGQVQEQEQEGHMEQEDHVQEVSDAAAAGKADEDGDARMGQDDVDVEEEKHVDPKSSRGDGDDHDVAAHDASASGSVGPPPEDEVHEGTSNENTTTNTNTEDNDFSEGQKGSSFEDDDVVVVGELASSST